MTEKETQVEDLVEFYEKWPDLRKIAQDLLTDGQLRPDQKSVLRSMIHMVDCVGPADIKSGEGPERS